MSTDAAVLVTADEIRAAGFSWPLHETYADCVASRDGRVDLAATRDALLRRKAYWDREYAGARDSIRRGAFPGAMSVDEITDADAYAERFADAARTVERIIAALSTPR